MPSPRACAVPVKCVSYLQLMSLKLHDYEDFFSIWEWGLKPNRTYTHTANRITILLCTSACNIYKHTKGLCISPSSFAVSLYLFLPFLVLHLLMAFLKFTVSCRLIILLPAALGLGFLSSFFLYDQHLGNTWFLRRHLHIPPFPFSIASQMSIDSSQQCCKICPFTQF